MNIERPLKGTRGRSHKLISKKYQNSHNNKCNSSWSWANKGPVQGVRGEEQLFQQDNEVAVGGVKKRTPA